MVRRLGPAVVTSTRKFQHMGASTGNVTPRHVVEVERNGHLVPLFPVLSTVTSDRVKWDGVTLNSFRDIPACEIPEHVHPTHTLSLLTSPGTNVEWTTGGRTRSGRNRSGNIYLLPAGTRDRLGWDAPTSRIVMTLESRVLARAFEETAHRDAFELVERWTLADQHLTRLMMALHADLDDGSPAGRLYGESISLAIAVYLARRYGVPSQKTHEHRGGLPGHRLRSVLDYVRAHLDRDIPLADLAAVAGMSPHYFAELFRKSTGETPHQFVLAARIEHAKRLLRNPALTALDVALLVGFVDASHFTKVFRRVVGATPSRFRADL
jgi:AraC family transcriptional regulator